MHSLVGLRAGRRTLRAGLGAGLVAVLALAVLLVASAAGASGAPTPPVAPVAPVAPVSPAGATAAPFGIIVPAPGNIIVVQRAAGQDALWSVDALTKTSTKLIDLPFRPARVEQSPGGRRLALLPQTAGPVVYVYDTHTGTLVSRSLAALGVKVVDSLTWLSSTKLLVAGKRTAGFAFYPFADRLYVLNAATGAAARYRGLRGTEPTVAPGADSSTCA